MKSRERDACCDRGGGSEIGDRQEPTAKWLGAIVEVEKSS
jgi:hypothetical protein